MRPTYEPTRPGPPGQDAKWYAKGFWLIDDFNPKDSPWRKRSWFVCDRRLGSIFFPCRDQRLKMFANLRR
jgi:hypothetical protein